MQLEAAPKKDEKKDQQGKAKAAAPKQRQASKPASRPKPVASNAPQRPKVARSAPKPKTQKPVASAPQRRPSSAPARFQRSVAQKPKQQRSENVARASAPERKDVARNATERARAKIERSQNQSAKVEKSFRRDVDRQDNRPSSRPTSNERASAIAAAADREAARNAMPDRDERTVRPDRSDRANRAAGDVATDRDTRPDVRPSDRAERGQRDLLNGREDRARTGAANERIARDERRATDRARADRERPNVSEAHLRKQRVARSEVRERVAARRKQQVARQAERNRERVQQFRENRQRRVAAVQAERQELRTLAAANRRENIASARIAAVRRDSRDYWRDRADDIRYRVADRRDYLFDDDWWEHRDWRHRPIVVSDPWWWWRPANWNAVNVFLDMGWSEPIAYDYGTDVIYDDDYVYVRGERIGTPVEYSQQVIELANPPAEVVAEAPVVETEWTPLGVWALVQENQGDDAVMFFQLSVDKDGYVSGAYTNVISGEVLQVAGQVDRSTQRAAWHIGDQKEKVFEAGMANLTDNQASCLVHTAPGEMQTWLLVRMESPNLPNRPASLSAADQSDLNTAANP